MAARPATRVVRERPAETARPRPVVRDLSRGPASFRIDWDVRPAFDFVFSLWDDAGETDDLPAADRAWLAEHKGAMPADVAAKFKPLEFGQQIVARRRGQSLQKFMKAFGYHCGVVTIDEKLGNNPLSAVGAV